MVPNWHGKFLFVASYQFSADIFYRCNKRIPRDEARIVVDLDQEAGKNQAGRDGVYYLSILKTTVIRMQMLKSYIEQKADWDDHVLECMSKFQI
jgi:hypothetical protein